MIVFVRNPRTGLIKMGVTINLPMRLAQLRSDYPNLELLGVMAGSFNEKTNLHQRFAGQRIRRTDWFRDCEALRDFIAANTTLDVPHTGSLNTQIDIPVSLSPYVRTMLEQYLHDLRAAQEDKGLSHNDALREIFEKYLPQYAERAGLEHGQVLGD